MYCQRIFDWLGCTYKLRNRTNGHKLRQYFGNDVPEWRGMRIHKRCLFVAGLGVLLALGMHACESGPKYTYQHLKEQAQSAFEAGNVVQAADTWAEAVSLYPEQPTPYAKLARVHISRGKLGQARKAYQQALSLQPEQPSWRYELGKVCILQGDRQCVQRCLAHLDQEGMHFSLLRGDSLFGKGRYAQALQAYARVLNKDPEQEVALIRSALGALSMDQMDKAQRLYARLAADPSLAPETWLEMVDYWKLRGEHIKAEELLLQAVGKHPHSHILYHRLVEMYLDKEELEQLWQSIANMKGSWAQDLYLHKVAVQCLLGLGRLDQAEQRLQALVKQVGQEDPDYVLLVGSLYLLQGKTGQAVGQFERAEEIMSTSRQLAVYLKGVALMQGGKIHLAEKAFIQALAMDPGLTRAELALAATRYRHKDLQTALGYVQRVLQREPENAAAHLFQGIIRLAAGDSDQAMDSLQVAQSLSPQMSETELFQGLVHERQGQTRQAVRVYLDMLCEHNQLWIEPAMGLIRLGDAHALRTLQGCLQARAGPKTQRSVRLYVQGLIAKAGQKTGKAIDALEKSVHLAPSFTAAYVHLAELYREQGRWRRVVSCLEQAVHNKVDSKRIYSLLAQAYKEQGQRDKAIDTLQKGVECNPEYAPLAANLAWMYLEQKRDVSEAFNLAQKAYNLSPNKPAVVDTLGWAFYQRDLYTRAVWLFEQALSLEPDNPMVHYHLGLAWQAQGKTQQAARALQRAVQGGLCGSEKARAEQVLYSLNRTSHPRFRETEVGNGPGRK